MIRVLIVDDHTLFADAIRSTLADVGMQIVGVAGTGREAVRIAKRERPDVALVDVHLPDENGLVVGQAIMGAGLGTKIIVVTAANDRATAAEALRMGWGFVVKDTPLSAFVGCIDAAINGQPVLSRRRASSRARSTVAGPDALLVDQLTPRELEVLSLLVQGVTGDAIAKRLGISRNTTRTHIQSILTKLQVHSRLEAAAFAVRTGIVKVPIGGAPSLTSRSA
jgi:two-component system, NarL family, nitrate/nitrite response regulator NarL